MKLKEIRAMSPGISAETELLLSIDGRWYRTNVTIEQKYRPLVMVATPAEEVNAPVLRAESATKPGLHGPIPEDGGDLPDAGYPSEETLAQRPNTGLNSEAAAVRPDFAGIENPPNLAETSTAAPSGGQAAGPGGQQTVKAEGEGTSTTVGKSAPSTSTATGDSEKSGAEATGTGESPNPHEQPVGPGKAAETESEKASKDGAGRETTAQPEEDFSDLDGDKSGTQSQSTTRENKVGPAHGGVDVAPLKK